MLLDLLWQVYRLKFENSSVSIYQYSGSRINIKCVCLELLLWVVFFWWFATLFLFFIILIIEFLRYDIFFHDHSD